MHIRKLYAAFSMACMAFGLGASAFGQHTVAEAELSEKGAVMPEVEESVSAPQAPTDSRFARSLKKRKSHASRSWRSSIERSFDAFPKKLEGADVPLEKASKDMGRVHDELDEARARQSLFLKKARGGIAVLEPKALMLERGSAYPLPREGYRKKVRVLKDSAGHAYEYISYVNRNPFAHLKQKALSRLSLDLELSVFTSRQFDVIAIEPRLRYPLIARFDAGVSGYSLNVLEEALTGRSMSFSGVGLFVRYSPFETVAAFVEAEYAYLPNSQQPSALLSEGPEEAGRSFGYRLRAGYLFPLRSGFALAPSVSFQPQRGFVLNSIYSPYSLRVSVAKSF